MDNNERMEIYDDISKRIKGIATSKAHDYAGKDILSNFKTVSTAAKELNINVSDPTNYALFMVLLKIARISNLLNSGKTPNNESVEDSFIDGINYLQLAYCTYIEKLKEKETNEEKSN